jgi:hypothetical protein
LKGIINNGNQRRQTSFNRKDVQERKFVPVAEVNAAVATTQRPR